MGVNDIEDAQYDGDSNGDLGSESTDDDYDGDDQHKSKHSTKIEANVRYVRSSPAVNHADDLMRPMKPASFGSILRKLFKGQQQLPWVSHPMSAFMKTDVYRRFRYCATSGEYTVFEVSGAEAVFLTSFTENAQTGVRL